jgi:hypothetical protein
MSESVINKFQSIDITNNKTDKLKAAIIEAVHLLFKIGPVVKTRKRIVETQIF